MKLFVEPKPRLAKVKDLVLDPNNPRLRLYPGGVQEDEIIERLCQIRGQSPALIIKKLIADGGFINSFIPTVYRRNGTKSLVVIDGNRRVAALKMVLFPTLIPSTRHGLKSDCDRLRGLLPEEIRFWFTDNEADAARIVYRTHNDGTAPWDTLSRYAAHYRDYNLGQSIADIAAYTASTPNTIRNEINTWILVSLMIQELPGFKIDDVGITNFERVTTNYSRLPQTLGFGVTAEGVYVVPNDKKLAEVIQQIYLKSAKAPRKNGEEEAFTRKWGNNDKSRAEFLGSIVPQDFKPVTSAGDAVSPAPSLAKSNHASSVPAPQKASAPNALKGSKNELPSDRQVLSVRRNVGKKAYETMTEFNRLEYDSPIARAALARVMIETTLKFYAKRLGCYSESEDQQKRNWSEELKAIADKLKSCLIKKGMSYSSDLVSAIANCVKSIPELNDVIHKDTCFHANAAVKSSLAALAAAVEELSKIKV